LVTESGNVKTFLLLQVTAAGTLRPAGAAFEGYRRAVLSRRRAASLLASSTPRRHDGLPAFLFSSDADLRAGGDAPVTAADLSIVSTATSMANYGEENMTVTDPGLDKVKEQPPPQPLFSFRTDNLATIFEDQEEDRQELTVHEEQTRRNGGDDCIVALLVGVTVLAGVAGALAAYASPVLRRTAWSHLVALLSALFADPDVDLEVETLLHASISSGSGGGDDGGGGGGEMSVSAAAMICHLLWVASTGVLFAGLTCGCRPRTRLILVCPWLLMLIFSHLTTASALFDSLISLSGHTEASKAASWPQVSLCAATVVFGSAAIFLLWREVKLWKQL